VAGGIAAPAAAVVMDPGEAQERILELCNTKPEVSKLAGPGAAAQALGRLSPTAAEV